MKKLKFPNVELMCAFEDSYRPFEANNRWRSCSINNSGIMEVEGISNELITVAVEKFGAIELN